MLMRVGRVYNANVVPPFLRAASMPSFLMQAGGLCDMEQQHPILKSESCELSEEDDGNHEQAASIMASSAEENA